MNGPVPGPDVPALDVQRQFWNRWNASNRTSADLDPFQVAQRDVARGLVARSAAEVGPGRPLRILDLGCGTGWLGASLTPFGEVTGVDLSPTAIELGRRRFPDVRLLAGDFSQVDLTGPFDVVVSADVLAHLTAQQGYVDLAASLLRPGGVLLVMTQNGYVWRRSSYLAPQGDGQIRDWPSLRRVRQMLARGGFDVVRTGSIDPGGDQGLLRAINNRYTVGLLAAMGLGPTWHRARERLRVGRELTVEARRR